MAERLEGPTNSPSEAAEEAGSAGELESGQLEITLRFEPLELDPRPVPRGALELFYTSAGTRWIAQETDAGIVYRRDGKFASSRQFSTARKHSVGAIPPQPAMEQKTFLADLPRDATTAEIESAVWAAWREYVAEVERDGGDYADITVFSVSG